MHKKFFGMDYGCTKLRFGEVNPITGDIHNILKYSSTKYRDDDKLVDLIKQLIPDPRNAGLGICYAGDVDEENLVVNLSANSGNELKKSFAQELRSLGYDVILVNDARALTMGVSVYGEGKDHHNVIGETFSTGFGAAFSSGRIVWTHAEPGHMPYRKNPVLHCSENCNNEQHLEPYVSGKAGEILGRKFFNKNYIKHPNNRRLTIEHPILQAALKEYNLGDKTNKILKTEDMMNDKTYNLIVSNIGSKHVYEAYRREPKGEPQKNIRDLQVESIADSFGILVSVYNPVDIIVYTGSLGNEQNELMLPAIELYRNRTLNLPSLSEQGKPIIVRTAMPEPGVSGAVAYYLQKKDPEIFYNL